MTASQAKHPTDHRALPVATAALHKSEAELVILFGSRARGDYNDQKSDIDVMLVQEKEPDASHRKTVAEAAAKTAGKTYGHPIPVELVWRTLDEFRFNRRFINSVETNAVRDGIIMPRNPESYSSHNYEDEETEYAYDWSNYEERLHHAETHLNEFIFMADHDRSDLVIGQQAQNALEHGMKALIAAAGGQYSNTHDIGPLIGNIRHFDPEMRDYKLIIPPDVYTEYESLWLGGTAEYRERRQPELTRYPGFAESTFHDVTNIINRAREIRSHADQ